MHSDESLAADRLVGVQAIANFRGEPKRRTQYLIETNQIPYGREGKWIVASKRVLREHHEHTCAGRQAA